MKNVAFVIKLIPKTVAYPPRYITTLIPNYRSWEEDEDVIFAKTYSSLKMIRKLIKVTINPRLSRNWYAIIEIRTYE